MMYLTSPPSYQLKWDATVNQGCHSSAIFYLFSDSLTWLCTAIFTAILVRSPVSGLVEFQPPEVRLKQTQTEMKLLKLNEEESRCDIPLVFLWLTALWGLCRGSELWENEEQQEGEMTVSHI